MRMESVVEIDRKLRELARRTAETDYEVCVWLRRGFLESVHEVGGFASFTDYVEHVLELTPRQTLERLRVAEALEGLPELNERFARGDVSWSKVRELTRVTTVESEVTWLEATEGRTARERREERVVVHRAAAALHRHTASLR